MKVKIKIDNAIVALEKNLDVHVVEFHDAIDVWTADAITALEHARDAVTRNQLKADVVELWNIFHRRPVDNRPNYSKYLGMLRQAREAGEIEIVCDEDEYDRIFQDNWDWRISSRATNTAYAARK